MSLFCFLANFKTIYGGKSSNTILFSPKKKKGKKGTKKGKSGFWSKIVQNSQNSNFPKNLPFTLFSLFDKKPITNPFPFPTLFLIPKQPFLACKSTILWNFEKLTSRSTFCPDFDTKIFKPMVPFLLLDQFKNHLRGK